MLFKEREVNSRKKIKEILQRPEIGKILDSSRERKEVSIQFKKYSRGGITKDEARKILGKFHYNKKDSLNGKETAGLARALGIRGVHKYKRPEASFGREAQKDEGRRADFANDSNKSAIPSRIKLKGFSKMNPLR